VSEAVIQSRAEEENAPVPHLHGRRSEDRDVKRDPPRPRSHRWAPSHPVSGVACLRTGDTRSAKETFRVSEHEPQGSVGERFPRARAPQGLSGGQKSLRWEATE